MSQIYWLKPVSFCREPNTSSGQVHPSLSSHYVDFFKLQTTKRSNYWENVGHHYFKDNVTGKLNVILSGQILWQIYPSNSNKINVSAGLTVHCHLHFLFYFISILICVSFILLKVKFMLSLTLTYILLKVSVVSIPHLNAWWTSSVGYRWRELECVWLWLVFCINWWTARS